MKVLVLDMGSRLNRFGGEERIAAILYRKLKKSFRTYYLGYETDYLGKSNSSIIIPRSSSTKGVRNSAFSEMRVFRAGYYYVFVRGLRGLGMRKEQILHRVRRINPDVILANSIHDYALLSYFRSSGLGFKSVYVDHGSISTSNTAGYFSKEGMPLTMGTGINAASVAKAKQRFFESFDVSVALNLSQFREMKKIAKKVVYIPNGISNTGERNPKMEERFRSRFNISKNDFVVLYVGRMFDRQKNVSTLIKAFTRTKGEDLKLLLVGSGPSFQDYVRLSNGDSRILFAGPRTEEEINSVYNMASLLVLPSNWEGFPLTILDAAAHSLPIILSSNAYTDDFRSAGIRMETFGTHSPEELAKKIMKMHSSASARKNAVKTSLALSRTFGEKAMIGKYRKLISDLG